MKTLLKFILIALFCISKIKSACTGTVAQSACDSSCKWTQTVAAGCSGGTGCSDNTEQTNCASPCTWNAAALGTCADKTCADYTTEPTCKAVSTCQWASSTCSTKTDSTTTTCSSYTTESTCKAVTTCQWSNNACSAKSTTTPTTTTPDDDNEDDGVFGLKSSILIFLISFLF